ELQRIGRGQRSSISIDLDMRVDVEQPLTGAVELRAADVRRAVHHLPLQVRLVDDIVVHEPDASHARRGEVHTQRRAEPARADDKHTARFQPPLAVHADLRHDQVAAVAPDLRIAEFHRFDGRLIDYCHTGLLPVYSVCRADYTPQLRAPLAFGRSTGAQPTRRSGGTPGRRARVVICALRA